MTEICDLDVTAIEMAVTPYRDALYHRNIFVEGMRQIAVRNLAHRHRAALACGYVEGSTENGMETVVMKMLEDQRLENSQVNRNFLVIATFVSVEIYLCLLYASIEFYRDVSSKKDFHKDKRMDACLARHAGFVSLLGEFRHSFLHPVENGESAQRKFLEIKGLYDVALDIQEGFDAYLEGIRRKATKFLRKELAKLPEIQRAYCCYRAFPWIAERMALCHDPEGMEELKGWMAEHTDRMKQISKVDRLWHPSKEEEDSVFRISRCLYEISPSIIERYRIPLDSEKNQTPFSSSALVFKLMRQGLERGVPRLDLQNRHEAHISRAMYPLSRLLLAVYVLLNESIYTFQAFPRRDVAALDAPMISGSGIRRIAGFQRASEFFAPIKIIMALLYEPLRLYRKAAERNSDFRSEVLEEYLAISGREEAHRDFRNSVFHVVANAVEVDHGLSATEVERAFGTYPAVISELSRLFLRHPGQRLY